MKKTILVLVAAGMLLAAAANTRVFAGEMDVLVNKLVEKGVLTPYEAQILLAEAKEEAARDLAKGEAITAPSWTQKIKMKGDVRFRTQMDWGKGLGPAHERIRQRVRARLGVEGKVNDQINAGIYAVTGGTDPRSTNQTLDDNFETQDFRLDGYWIEWTPELSQEIGTGHLWMGKYKNPLTKSEVIWDGDILPAGVTAEYESPTFDLGEAPTMLYGSANMFWLDEISNSQRDPLMFVGQVGMKMDIISDWDSVINMAFAYYDTSHLDGNLNFSNIGSAGTNTYWTGALAGSHRYDFNMVDFIAKYDSKQLFDFHFGHGLFTDLVWNTAAESREFAFEVGGYVGDKKPKKPGQWKLWGLYRYIERDAVPDFLPDSDFAGFTAAGVASGGGTNAQGVNCGIQYAILKNTVLSAEYYYMTPIDVNDALSNEMDEPYQILQLDVVVKF